MEKSQRWADEKRGRVERGEKGCRKRWKVRTRSIKTRSK